MKHRTFLSTLLAIAAAVGLVLVGTSNPADAHGRRLRAEMDVTFVADSGVVEDGAVVSYVGTFDFGRNRVYGLAFFSPSPPAPIFDDWVSFAGSWEIYDTTDFYTIEDGIMTSFDRPDAIVSAMEWGFGSFGSNDWHALGIVTDVDADGIRLFRHLDPGDRVTWAGEFTSPTQFHAHAKFYVR